jgi:hypothetical protein
MDPKLQDSLKDKLIEFLVRTPIVQVACEKIGIGRATYYRWLKIDPDFKSKAENAICIGKGLINDLAESQLISAIKDQNMTAIIFWLKNNHQNYKQKIELSGELMTKNRELTPEEIEQIKKSFNLK